MPVAFDSVNGSNTLFLTQSTWPLWLAAAEIRAGQSACLCIILCVGVCPNAALPVRAPMLALLVSWVALPWCPIGCHGAPFGQSISDSGSHPGVWVCS
jgi:hypothetical protein